MALREDSIYRALMKFGVMLLCALFAQLLLTLCVCFAAYMALVALGMVGNEIVYRVANP
jgi:hypothetical protein